MVASIFLQYISDNHSCLFFCKFHCFFFFLSLPVQICRDCKDGTEAIIFCDKSSVIKQGLLNKYAVIQCFPIKLSQNSQRHIQHKYQTHSAQVLPLQTVVLHNSGIKMALVFFSSHFLSITPSCLLNIIVLLYFCEKVLLTRSQAVILH